ncbi:hypothetical protein K0M31_012419 [Melipona bicolor]|uniref:Uncharacterized protein n=1 Tax=Melipona bicolor TaxID=60889 RepID=A0AA40FJV2_9HYME|nr:hypothetical protein K0M31_012419 [Melipona bicolor]
MVGSNGTMIAIRLVRSKLRKREDHSNAVHPEAAVVQTATSPVSTIVAPSYPGEGCCTQTSITTTSTDLGNSTSVEQDNVYATANPADQIVWQFPPPYPPPHTPAQYALYNDQFCYAMQKLVRMLVHILVDKIKRGISRLRMLLSNVIRG